MTVQTLTERAVARAYRLTGALQRIIAPNNRYSQDLFRNELERRVRPGIQWLDLGCGHQLLPPWRLEEERALLARAARVVGMDFDLPSLRVHRSIAWRVRGDAGAPPFAEGSFDLVTANMVVEHLGEPERQFREIARLLRPGGLFVFHTPNAGGYPTVVARLLPEALKPRLARMLDGREGGDVFPTYYRANAADDIRRLAAATAFRVVALELVCTAPILARLPPLAAIELCWLRLLESDALAARRTNIIAVLERVADAGAVRQRN